MNIIIDTDGVLAQFTEHMIDALNTWGAGLKLSDFRRYDLLSCIPRDFHKVFERLPTNRNFANSVPRYPWAQSSLKALVAKGHSVTLVTSPWRDSGVWAEARSDWFDSLLSPKELSKVEYQFCTPDERCCMPGDVLIDDRFETMQKWSETNRPGILIDHPWNRECGPLPRLIVRADNIQKALDYI